MNDIIREKLKSLNYDLVKDKALFVSKLTNELLVMKINEIEALEKIQNKPLNKIDKNVVVKCCIIRDNKILDALVDVSLDDIWFTDRMVYSDGRSFIRLLD